MSPVRLVVAGVTVSLEVDGPDSAAGPLLCRWSHVRPAGPAAEGAVSVAFAARLSGAPPFPVQRDGAPVYAAPTVEDALLFLELDAYRHVAHVTRATPLHAASLRREGGPAVVLAGPSGAGKSAHALELSRRGLLYLGDEHAFVSPDGAVEGWPRPIRVGDAPAGDEGLTPPRTGVGPAEVGLVVLLEAPRAPGARPRRLAPAEAAARLLGLVQRPPRPEDARTLAGLAARAPAYGLAVEGVDTSAACVLELLRA